MQTLSLVGFYIYRSDLIDWRTEVRRAINKASPELSGAKHLP